MACDCPACTGPVADNDDWAVLIHAEEDLKVHWLVNYLTDGSTWDVAACGTTLDIDSPHLRVRDEIRLKDLCRDCMVNVAAFFSLGENERLHEQLQIAKDGLVEIRNLDRSDWKPEAVKAHETLTRLGWRP